MDKAGGTLRLPVLSLRDVSKRYGRVNALVAVDLDVEEGEILALIGPNGSGKSTLLRIMATLQKPDFGRILLFGSEGGSEVLRKVGFLFDHTAHWDDLTGYENAWFFARSYGLSEEEAAKSLGDLFPWAMLQERRDDAVATYSFGMSRKLAILEALAHNPKLVLMDEPTLGLDYSSRLALQSLLKARVKSGTAVVLATNDVDEAEAIASRVAVLRQGRIVAVGEPNSLVASLNALTRVNLKLSSPLHLDILREVDGVVGVEPGEDGYEIRLLMDCGRNCLLSVVKAVTDQGGSVKSLEIREPTLGDVLLRFTGEGDTDVT
jgi:ABC-type multidrug transport system ATPase subunit